MQVLFKAGHDYKNHNNASGVKIVGSFRGEHKKFLAILAKLYQLPCLFEGEHGSPYELIVDFVTDQLKISFDMNGCPKKGYITHSISFFDLLNRSEEELRYTNLTEFAAKIAKSVDMDNLDELIMDGIPDLDLDEVVFSYGDGDFVKSEMYCQMIVNLITVKEWS